MDPASPPRPQNFFGAWVNPIMTGTEFGGPLNEADEAHPPPEDELFNFAYWRHDIGYAHEQANGIDVYTASGLASDRNLIEDLDRILATDYGTRHQRIAARIARRYFQTKYARGGLRGGEAARVRELVRGDDSMDIVSVEAPPARYKYLPLLAFFVILYLFLSSTNLHISSFV